MLDNMVPYLLKLKSHNIKITQERKHLIKIFLQFPEYHFTPNELYDQLKANGYNIGFATIYRNLKLFQKINLISSISLDDGSKKYEWNYREVNSPVFHIHFICSHCGKVLDYEPENNDFIIPDIRSSSLFDVEDIEVQIRGICNECIQSIK